MKKSAKNYSILATIIFCLFGRLNKFYVKNKF